MGLEYIGDQNIFELFGSHVEYGIMIQGCNCFHTMGKGIALEIKKRYPEVFDADLATNYGDYDKLGTFSKATIERDGKTLTIYNLYSQYKFGNKDVMINYAAIEKGLYAIAEDIVKSGIDDQGIIMPFIGGNNGGGDPIFIKQIVQGTLGDLEVSVVGKFADVVRDKVHVIQFPITLGNSLRDGFRLFAHTSMYSTWMKAVSKKSTFIMDSMSYAGELELYKNMIPGQWSERNRIDVICEAVEEGAYHPQDWCDKTFYGDNIERAILHSRDYCIQHGLDTVYIIGMEQSLFDRSLEYCDLVHHLDLRQTVREADELPDYSANVEFVNPEHPNFTRKSKMFGSIDEEHGAIFTEDVVYRRTDKPYRNY